MASYKQYAGLADERVGIRKTIGSIKAQWKDLSRIFHEFEAFICKTHTLIHIIKCVIPLAGAFRDAAVLMLPQVPDNAANGRLELVKCSG
jgi:hypothetical protein